MRPNKDTRAAKALVQAVNRLFDVMKTRTDDRGSYLFGTGKSREAVMSAFGLDKGDFSNWRRGVARTPRFLQNRTQDLLKIFKGQKRISDPKCKAAIDTWRSRNNEALLNSVIRLLVVHMEKLDGPQFGQPDYWAYSETAQYGAEDVLATLRRSQNFSLLAMDNAVALYVPRPLAGFRRVHISVVSKPPCTEDLKYPSTEMLRRCIEQQSAQFNPQMLSICARKRRSLYPTRLRFLTARSACEHLRSRC
jgi:hypothetical protein